MKKELPITPPLISSFGQQAWIFSTLYSNPECHPWIFNNYIQTFTLKNLYKMGFRRGTLDFFYNQYGDFQYYELKANPWLQFHSIPYGIPTLMNIDIVEMIKKLINLEQYVVIDVNTYYVSTYKKHFRHEYSHPLFIYGYDDNTQNFLVMDNFNVGKFAFEIVNFNELRRGYQSIEKEFLSNTKLVIHGKGIISFKISKQAWQTEQEELFKINTIKIKNDIKEYLLIDHYAESYRSSDYYSYGIECYDELLKFVSYALETHENIDHRAFSAFRDHKILMLERIKFLKENKYLQDTKNIEELSQYLVDNMKQLVFLIIKYNLTKKEHILNKISDKLKDCKNKEYTMLMDLISLL